MDTSPPTWKNTFNCDLEHWYGHIGKAFDAAHDAGYPYISWNGRVYLTSSNGDPDHDTIILTKDLK